jgi:ATP-dependent DNA helicase RecG
MDDVLDLNQLRSVDSMPVRGVGVSALDERLTREHLDRAIQRSRYAGTTDVEEFWRMSRMIARDGDTWTPTLAGLVCFGANPQEFFPSAVVSLMHYPGAYVHSGEVLNRARVAGTIIEQIQRVQTYLFASMRQGGRLAENSFERIDLPQFPHAAVREAIVNALVHRDYTDMGSSVDVHLFSTHIQITNPGGLLAGITVDLLPSIHKSRNPIIAAILRQAGLSEEAGQGVKTILREYEIAGLTRPIFEDLKGLAFRVTLAGHAPELYDTGTLSRLDPRKRHILAFIRTHQPASSSEIRSHLAQMGDPIQERQAQRQLTDLVEMGLLVRNRGQRTTTYELSATTPLQMDLDGTGENR